MGREAGVPNKSKQTLIKLLEARYPDYNPVYEMVDIALDKENDVNTRLAANDKVAGYLIPKLKAVELTGLDGKDLIPATIQIIHE